MEIIKKIFYNPDYSSLTRQTILNVKIFTWVELFMNRFTAYY